MLAAAAVFFTLLLLWAEVSALWVSLGTAVVAALSQGSAAPVPPNASMVLPIACAALVAVDLTLRRRLFWVSVALAATFGLELLLIAGWALTGAPPSAVVIPGDAVQVLLPVAALALAVAESRREVRRA